MGVWTIIFSLIFCSVLWSVKTRNEEFSWKSFFRFAGQKGFGIWLCNLLLYVTIFFLPWFLLLLSVCLVPLYFLNGAAAGLDDGSLGQRFKRGFKYSTQQYGKALLLLLVFLGLTAIIMQPIAFVLSIHDIGNEPTVPDFLDMIVGFIKRVGQIFFDGFEYIALGNAFRQVIYVLFILGILPLIIISMAFGYYSELERTEASGLRQAFGKFGKRSRTHETEIDFE